jgi:hypothetical protein
MTSAVALRPVGGRGHEVSLWLSVSTLATAFLALAVWFVVTVSTANHSTSTTPTVQQGGGTGHNNQLCVPAPGTRYC